MDYLLSEIDPTVNVENYTRMPEDSDIVYFDNVISEEMCKYILNECSEKETFIPSVTIGDALREKNTSDYRKSSEIKLSASPSLKHIDNYVFKVFDEAIKKYAQVWQEFYNNPHLQIGIERDEGYILLKYEEGGSYEAHIDILMTPKSPRHRNISGLLYLNGDFEGGGTEFLKQKTTIVPKAGRVAFFPSSYTHPHRSVPVEKGVKYAIVTWFD